MSQWIVQEYNCIFNFSEVYDKILKEMRKNIDILVLFFLYLARQNLGQKKNPLIKENYDLIVVPRWDTWTDNSDKEETPEGQVEPWLHSPGAFTRNNAFLPEVHHFAICLFTTLHYASHYLNCIEYLQLPKKWDFATIWTLDVPFLLRNHAQFC